MTTTTSKTSPTPAATTQAMPALRLSIYIPNFTGGGVERVNLMLIDAFIARGIDVTVVVHRPAGELRALLPMSVRLVSLDVGRSLAALPRMVAYLHREQPDVLLSSLGHNNIVALWARALLRLTARCRTRVIICQHNALSVEAHAVGNWQHAVLPRLYRWFGGQATAIVGVSDGVSDDMARATGIARERITTIHNPVIDSRFAAALAAPSTHRWLRDPALRVIVGIGRLVPQKDFATLVAAFARLARPETRLLILGEGPEHQRLAHKIAAPGIADRAELAGFEINPLPTLRDASVMAMSSIYEGFGNVLVEALGAGVPVVATRCPFGPAEILDDGRYGELVPVSDPDALAAAIGRQLDAPRPDRAERQARAHDFHIDAVAGKYVALFDRGGPRAAPPSSRPAAPARAALAAPAPAPDWRRRGVVLYLPSLCMGGSELSLVRLAEGFAARGLVVTLVTHDVQRCEIAVPGGVTRISIGATRSLAAVTQLSRLLRRHRPAFLLTAFPHSNVVAVAARRLSGVDCRLVLSEHAPLTEQYRRMGGWRYRLLPPFVRWAYPRADAIVAVSDGVRADLVALDPRLAPQVIYNPVLPACWRERAAEPTAHPWLEDAALEVVLSISRLAVEKNVPDLVQAFAIVAANRPAARLVIAGDGPARAAIEQSIARCGIGAKVQLVGIVANPLAWMRRARVFALASQYEGFGNVLVEALAAGTQVISTDCPVGPREVLQGGRLGRLVPVGDASALAAAIGAALAGDGSARRVVDPQGIAAEFTQDRACTAYLALFERIAIARPFAPAP